MDLITPDFGLIFWQTVTLLVVLLILGRFAWRPVLAAIEAREEQISTALQAAAEARILMAQVQADKKALLKNAQIEREKIIKEAITVKNNILEEAQKEAQKVSTEAIEQTRTLLHQEKILTLATLRNEVAELSVQMAEKVLQKELKGAEEQKALIQELLQAPVANRH